MRLEVKGWISSAAQRLKEAIVSLSVVTLLATVNDPCPQSCLWKFLSAPLYSNLGNKSLQMDVNGSSLVWYYPLSMHASDSDASIYRHKLKQACCSLYDDIVDFFY